MQYTQAFHLAETIALKLAPHCVFCRLHIAGSIRRLQPEVKDIEIVCQPLTEKETNLFGEVVKEHRSQEFIKALAGCYSEIKTGDLTQGRYAKFLLAENIMLDLFTPAPDDYYRQLAIRTGSAEYARRVIANAWLRKGWCGVKDVGLRRIKDCIEEKYPDGKSKWKLINLNGEKPPVWQSEREFFSWLGEPYIEPRWRLGATKSQTQFEAR